MRKWFAVRRSAQKTAPRRNHRRHADRSARGHLESLELRTLLTAQLQITPVSAPTSAVEGSLVDYKFQIQNVGDATASNVSFSDTLPGTSQFISASTSAGTIAESGGAVSASLGNLAAGATDIVEVRVTPTAAGTLNNSASASSPDAPTVTTTASTTATAADSSSTDLQLAGQATPASVVPGQPLHYSFTITNTDASHAAANVVLTDQLPSGAAFLGATTDGASVAETDGVVTATIGTLAAGQTAHVIIDVMATAAGSLADSAFVTTDSGDPQLSNNLATLDSTIGDADSAVAADLAVTTTPPAGTVLPGQAAVYTVTVANQGTNTASGVVLFDRLPDDVRYLYASSNQGLVSEGNNMVNVNVGDLAPGASATLTLAVSPSASGPLSNYAAAASASGELNPTNAVATDHLTVSATPPTAAALAVTKTDSAGGSTIAPGQPLAYTITVTNQSGSNAASNVMLTDVLPAGLAFVSAQSNAGATAGGASLGTVSVVNGSVVDSIGTLAAGASATLTVVTTPTQLGPINNMAIATTDSGTATNINLAADNVMAVAAAAGTADLQVTKTDSAGGAPMRLGQQLTYTITLSNQSATASANNVVLSDPLPSGVAYVSGSATSGIVAESDGIVTDHIAVLGPGQTVTLTVTVLVTRPGAIQNTAVVTSTQGDATPSGVVGADLVTAVPAGPAGADLSLTATRSSNNDLFVAGQAITYTIKVTNESASDAAGVIITDALPPGAVFVSANSTVGSAGNNQGVVVAANNTLTDNLGMLLAGQTATLTLVIMPMQTGITLTNHAAASTASGDPNPNNNTASDSVAIASGVLPVNFLLSQSASPTGVATQQELTYHLNVTNNSPNVALSVVLTDQLPSSMTFLSGSSLSGTVEDVNGYVIADLGTVFSGETVPVTLVVRPTQGGTFANTIVATTDSGATIPSNGVNTTTTLVNGGGGGGASLSLAATGLPDPVSIGGNLTYTVTVNNSGGSEADGVTLSDPLPPGVALVSDSVSQGTMSDSGGTVTAQLGRIGPHASATLTILVTPSTAGVLTNTITVGTTTPGAGDGTTTTVTTTVQPGAPPTLCYLPGQPGDGTDATFVSNLYRELLGRDPDASGQAFWLGFLASGGPTGALAQQHIMVQDFLASNEYRAHLVNCFYENFLHRAADSGGQQYFVGQLGAGVDPRTVLAEIVGAPEYTTLHGGTSQGFVDALYHDVLGRAPDSGGEAYWTSQASNPAVTHADIVRAFAYSPEADHLLLTNSTGSALANITGDGWDTLYFQGNLTQRAQDFFFAQLAGQTPYDNVLRNMLEVGQYYNAADVFLPPTPS